MPGTHAVEVGTVAGGERLAHTSARRVFNVVALYMMKGSVRGLFSSTLLVYTAGNNIVDMNFERTKGPMPLLFGRYQKLLIAVETHRRIQQ